MTGLIVFRTYVVSTFISMGIGIYLYIFKDKIPKYAVSVFNKIHSTISTIALIPLYLLLLALYSITVLILVLLAMMSFNASPNFSVYVSFCIWLFILTYTPYKLFYLIYYSVNTVSPFMIFNSDVGEFINYLLRGKVLAYIISSLFIIYTTYCTLTSQNAIQITPVFTQLLPIEILFHISNYAIATFIALDKVVEALIKKYITAV